MFHAPDSCRAAFHPTLHSLPHAPVTLRSSWVACRGWAVAANLHSCSEAVCHAVSLTSRHRAVKFRHRVRPPEIVDVGCLHAGSSSWAVAVHLERVTGCFSCLQLSPQRSASSDRTVDAPHPTDRQTPTDVHTHLGGDPLSQPRESLDTIDRRRKANAKLEKPKPPMEEL